MAFKLEIVTPEKAFYSDDVEMVIVRGMEGDLAVLENRAPLITPLAIGKVRITNDGKERIAAVTDGYITVTKEQTTIITDAAEWPEEINLERATEAKERAERRLEEKAEEIDVQRAEFALRRALNRLDVGNIKEFENENFK